MVQLHQDMSARRWRNIRLNFLVLRDSCLVFLALNCVIGLFGWVVRCMDTNQKLLSYFSKDCLVGGETALHSFWCQHTVTVYYLWGFLSFLVVLGALGLLIFALNGCRIPSADSGYGRVDVCDGCGDACCRGPCYCDCLDCYYCGNLCEGGAGAAGHGGCCCFEICDFGALSASGECALVLGVIALAVVVILAIFGLVVGVLAAMGVFQKVVQRHLRVQQKTQLAREFVVRDLSRPAGGEEDPEAGGAVRAHPALDREGSGLSHRGGYSLVQDGATTSPTAPLAAHVDLGRLPSQNPGLGGRAISEQNTSELRRLGLLE
ncbi:unnamed protein product [Heterosigma akashiwo]